MTQGNQSTHHNLEEGKSVQTPSEPACYASLTKAIDFPSDEQELWWRKSAPLLARILESADYDLHQQYQFLTLYNTLMVPNMGSFPHIWHASITHSGIPVEFSVNYQDKERHTVRVGFEPASFISGAARDPYNLITVTDVVCKMSRLDFHDFDSQLFHQFLGPLTLSKEEACFLQGAKLPGSNFKTQAAFGLDLKGIDVTVKCYIYPALKAHVTGKTFRQLLEDAVCRVEDSMNCFEAIRKVNDYMEERMYYNQYSFIGFDCTTPSRSRLKVYGAILNISWEKVEEIWTLGGLLQANEDNKSGLSLLRSLWEYLTPGKDRRPVGIWNYELVPGSLEPVPKFYIDVHGESDLLNATGIVKFFRVLGWNESADGYLDLVRSYFPEQSLEESTELIQYVSFAWTKAGPYFSVYYHSLY